MAFTRGRLIALVALVVLLGAGVVVLTSGDQPIIQVRASESVVKIEAAGVNYAGWPEMGVKVNGQDIGSLVIDTPQRTMFSFDVPNEIGDVSSIEVRLLNETDCKKADFAEGTMGLCTDRTLTIRGLYLNDEKREGGVASGEGNRAWALQRSEGGITWNIEK